MATVNPGDLFVGTQEGVEHRDISATFIEMYTFVDRNSNVDICVNRQTGHCSALFFDSGGMNILTFDSSFAPDSGLLHKLPYSVPGNSYTYKALTVKPSGNFLVFRDRHDTVHFTGPFLNLMEISSDGTILHEWDNLDTSGNIPTAATGFGFGSYASRNPLIRCALDCDNITVFYTDQGVDIFQFDTSTGSQGSVYALLGLPSFQYRLGGICCAGLQQVIVTLSFVYGPAYGPRFGTALSSASVAWSDEYDNTDVAFFQRYDAVTGAKTGLFPSSYAVPYEDILNIGAFFDPCVIPRVGGFRVSAALIT